VHWTYIWGILFATLDVECFQRCFVAWVASFTGISEDVIAIDGKTSRRAKQGGKTLLHAVLAFSARQRLVLGQTKVDEKSNEITAIPKLLAMLVLEGAIVTLDAMGCQREIAQAILDRQADYVLALNGNQGNLRESRYYVSSLRVPAEQMGGAGAWSLDSEEQPALGAGYGVSRRRMPGTHRPRTRELHHHQIHGTEPATTRQGQTLDTRSTQSRCMGR